MSSFACLSVLCFLLLSYCFTSSNAAIFEIRNECPYTVWAAALPGGGRRLDQGQTWAISVNPGTRQARIWARTNCSFDRAGRGRCETGDCNGRLQCQGYGQPPNTLAEYALNISNLDFFDISLVDGFNVPMDFSPVSGSSTCRTGIRCAADINGQCPIELRTKGGCNNPCTVFKTDQYCCFNNSGSCDPTDFSRFFKQRCPDAYSYPKDDETSTFTCPGGSGTNYMVIFCSTAGNSTNTTPGEITPSYPPEIRSNSTSSGEITPSYPPEIRSNSTSSGEITPSPPPEIRPNTTSRRHRVPIIAGIVGGVLVIIFFLVIIVWTVRGSKSNDAEDEEDDHIKQVPGMPVRFSYEDLRVATDDFKEILGRGGFGSVFKGVLADGTGIAVKRLDKLGQGSKRAFLAEVETIGSLHHFNLVRLIGFCAEKSYRLLVYEYLSNGSLDKWIFKKTQGSSIDWKTRKKIILDIAKGLAYLHEECRQTIMHLDIKPQNILLDPNFNAKISDFGLSKLVDREMSQVQLSMRGTPGYLAPEWRQALGRITVKVDVYSFGIVLLEVACARRTVDHSQPESAFHLLRMLQNKPEYVLERLDEYLQSDRDEIIRMLKVSAWCLQDHPERRPLMSTVVKALEGVMETDSNLVYKFSHALAPPLVADDHISSAPQPASVLSHPR